MYSRSESALNSVHIPFARGHSLPDVNLPSMVFPFSADKAIRASYLKYNNPTNIVHSIMAYICEWNIVNAAYEVKRSYILLSFFPRSKPKIPETFFNTRSGSLGLDGDITASATSTEVTQ